MDAALKNALHAAVAREPFAQALGIELVALEQGFSAVEMTYQPGTMNNIYARAHGGAIFSLIDEAFETVAQTDGTVAVALQVSVTYVSSPEPGERLRAEARQMSVTKKTAGYDIKVMGSERRIIATCQALAYRTGKPIPFLEQTP